MPRDDLPETAILAEVAAALDGLQRDHRQTAETARRGAGALRGDAAAVQAIGGEAARAHLAALALWMLEQSGDPASPADLARFLPNRSGYLGETPIDLVRTASGAEQVRRLLAGEPPLGYPDPERVAHAAALDDLTPEEAYVAYAEGRIASPRLMTLAGLRGIGGIMAALTQRNLRLPRLPSPVGPGRDDRDLLWEYLAGREHPALLEREPRHLRPAPPPSPVTDAAWPTAAPDHPGAQEALAAVAAALETEAAAREAEAARAAAAAAGLRGDAAAVGGEAARARLVAWVLEIVRRTREHGGQDQALASLGAALFLLQPLREPDAPFAPVAGGSGVLELARTAEDAAVVGCWLAPKPVPDPARIIAATDLCDLTPDEAYAAYAGGRIDSRRLMAAVGLEEGSFGEVWGQLALRGLRLPAVPTYIGPGRDDRDLLWEVFAGRAEG